MPNEIKRKKVIFNSKLVGLIQGKMFMEFVSVNYVPTSDANFSWVWHDWSVAYMREKLNSSIQDKGYNNIKG